MGNVDAGFTQLDPGDAPARWTLEVLDDLADRAIREDPTAYFLDSRAGPSPIERRERIRRAVRAQISKEQSVYVHDTVRLDLDRDGGPDLLFAYDAFADEFRADP